jgi:hypothetical protein
MMRESKVLKRQHWLEIPKGAGDAASMVGRDRPVCSGSTRSRPPAMSAACASASSSSISPSRKRDSLRGQVSSTRPSLPSASIRTGASAAIGHACGQWPRPDALDALADERGLIVDQVA